MFNPWIGDHYGSRASVLKGKRLLILGESHYPGQPELVGQNDPDCTSETVQEYAIEKPIRFFKKLMQLATGERVDNCSIEQTRAFWNAVVFYNYIPVFIAHPSEGKRPTAAQWCAGKAPFLEVLAINKPEILIVCGLTLWWYVMDALPGGVAANSPERDIA